MTSTSEQPPYTFGPTTTDLLGACVSGTDRGGNPYRGTIRALTPYCTPNGSIGIKVLVICDNGIHKWVENNFTVQP